MDYQDTVRVVEGGGKLGRGRADWFVVEVKAIVLNPADHVAEP